MYFSAATLAVLVPLVAAHGKVISLTGENGGNGTGIGIMGAVVPYTGANGKTEIDTTVFKGKNVATDGWGTTTQYRNSMNLGMTKQVMKLSGPLLPQIKSTGGVLSGVWNVVVTDGAGPIFAVIDPTGTAKFSAGKLCDVTQQVPGKAGNLKKGTAGGAAGVNKRSLMMRALDSVGIFKRATNVNENYAFKIIIPKGITCTGKVDGVPGGVCLIKIANNNAAGPFGSTAPIQIQDTPGGAAPAAPAAATRDVKEVEFSA